MPRVAAKDREAFVEARRAEIVEAALRLWSERGYDGTPLAAIAREVGLTKGTLYLYFGSKLALLEEVVRRHSLRLDVEALAERFRERPLEEAVRALVRTAWTRLAQLREAVGVLLRELPNHPELARQFLAQVVIPTNLRFASFLDEKLPPERAARINAVVAGRSLFAMVLMFFVSQELLGGAQLLPLPDGEIVDTIAEVFLRGVLGDSA